MSKIQKIITGIVTGAVVGIIMEILRGTGYVAGVSVTVKSIGAGVLAFVIYTLISIIVRAYGPKKA